ncbi:helix-hairpin-helix domain-containing protein [bacterium]|nr:helix-hairpin-helix domain-containing protein [bacterium]
MSRVRLITICLILGFVVLYALYTSSAGITAFYIIAIAITVLIRTSGDSILRTYGNISNDDSLLHRNLYTVNGQHVDYSPSEIAIIEDATRDRQIALNIAEAFIVGKYNNIWGGLKLSNKFCAVYLDKNGIDMRAYDLRSNNSRYFDIISPSGGYNHLEIWNMLCMLFNYDLTYDGLIKECRNCGFEIQLQGEKISIKEKLVTAEQTKTEDFSMPVLKVKLLPKIDINNCEEKELTNLPGINIVTAKKIIKKRKEIDGFKSIDDVFIFLKTKPHMQEQLKDRIDIKEMKKNEVIKLKTERSVDL